MSSLRRKDRFRKVGSRHSEIEMEFDRYLLTEDKFDPLTYRQTEHIHATEKNAKGSRAVF